MDIPPAWPEKAPALRRKILTEIVLPAVQQHFDRTPDMQSAMFLVAQFYNDNAEDAVHDHLLFSQLISPDLQAFYQAWQDFVPDQVNGGISTNPEGPESLEFHLSGAGFYWDSNGLAIPAFAAYCREGANQNMDYEDTCNPYAIFRKTADGIAVEVIGECLRPWLEGIRPGFWASWIEPGFPEDLPGWHAYLKAHLPFPWWGFYWSQSEKQYRNVHLAALASLEQSAQANEILVIEQDTNARLSLANVSGKAIPSTESECFEPLSQQALIALDQYSAWQSELRRQQEMQALTQIPEIKAWHWSQSQLQGL